MVPPPITSSTSQQQKLPLRRATYIHVSDLTSVYNIDNERLEVEIARVNAEKRNKIREGSNILDKTESNDKSVHGIRHGSPLTVQPDETIDNELSTPLIGQAHQSKRLQPPRGGFNLCVLVGRINIVVDKRRVDRSRVRLAEVEVGDETGTVSLRARDGQIDLLERVSRCKNGAVVLRNCTLELYQGKHVRLAVTKWGKLTEYPDNVASTPGPPPIMNLDRNFSLIDLSLVANEIVVEKELIESTSQLQLQSQSQSQTTTNANRKVKSSEAEKASRSIPSSKTSTLKSRQPSQTKHQQKSQTLSKRGNHKPCNERHQSRDVNYGRTTTIDNIKQPPVLPTHVAYHAGMQGYHYRHDQQSVDLRMQQRYTPMPYALSTRARTQQDVVSAQFAIRQQYEMQQRQLHHLYSREQQSRQSRQPQQQPSHGLVRPVNTFEIPRGTMIESTSQTELRNISTSSLDVTHSGQHSLNPISSSVLVGKLDTETSMVYDPSYLSPIQGSNHHEQQIRSLGCPHFAYDPSRPLADASMYQQEYHPIFYGQVHHTVETNINRAQNQDRDRGRGATVLTKSSSEYRENNGTTKNS